MYSFSEFPHDFTDYGLEGLDELLSKHIAHLFIRDPLVIFSETIHQDDTSSSDHFEVIDCWILPCFVLTHFKEHSIHQLANCPFQASPT